MQQLTTNNEEKQRMRRLNVVSLQLIKEQTFMYEKNKIMCPDDVGELAKRFIGDKDREHLILICLDTKNKITAIHTISIGNLNSAIVSPREVFKVAILSNSASIILAHNHPSGDPTPSKEDISVTKRIKEVSELLSIDLLDHVIVTSDNHYSMKEKGFI